MSRRTGPAAAAGWAAAIVATYVVVAALGGLLWRSRVHIPSGVVLDHRWYPDPWDPGQRDAFAATGWYVVIALVAGVVLGVLAGWVSRAPEVLTLAAVVVGSVAAALVMRLVGLHGAPPDPQLAAAHAAEGTRLSGTIAAPGRGALIAFPLASIVALALLFLILTPAAARTGDATARAE